MRSLLSEVYWQVLRLVLRSPFTPMCVAWIACAGFLLSLSFYDFWMCSIPNSYLLFVIMHWHWFWQGLLVYACCVLPTVILYACCLYYFEAVTNQCFWTLCHCFLLGVCFLVCLVPMDLDMVLWSCLKDVGIQLCVLLSLSLNITWISVEGTVLRSWSLDITWRESVLSLLLYMTRFIM